MLCRLGRRFLSFMVVCFRNETRLIALFYSDLFILRDVYIARICRGKMSVRPSVCLSHAGIILGSPTILVFPYQTGWRYSDGNPPNRGVECMGYDKMTIFFTNISLYLRNGYS